jgi:hypothetical protein
LGGFQQGCAGANDQVRGISREILSIADQLQAWLGRGTDFQYVKEPHGTHPAQKRMKSIWRQRADAQMKIDLGWCNQAHRSKVANGSPGVKSQIGLQCNRSQNKRGHKALRYRVAANPGGLFVCPCAMAIQFTVNAIGLRYGPADRIEEAYRVDWVRQQKFAYF